VETAEGDAPLAAVFGSVIDRPVRDPEASFGRVELAVDVGELVAGERRAALLEAELKLKAGAPEAVYDPARGHALAVGAQALP